MTKKGRPGLPEELFRLIPRTCLIFHRKKRAKSLENPGKNQVIHISTAPTNSTKIIINYYYWERGGFPAAKQTFLERKETNRLPAKRFFRKIGGNGSSGKEKRS